MSLIILLLGGMPGRKQRTSKLHSWRCWINSVILCCLLQLSVVLSINVIHFIDVAPPKFITETIKNIIEFASNSNHSNNYDLIHYDISLLSYLCNSEAVRSYIYKNKLIEELNERLNKCKFPDIFKMKTKWRKAIWKASTSYTMWFSSIWRYLSSKTHIVKFW